MNEQQIQIDPDELIELQRCHNCDCETYPICTNNGEPCDECFNLIHYVHNDVSNILGLFKKQQQQQVQERSLKNCCIKEIPTNGDGDCLYESFSMGLNKYLTQSPVATKLIEISDLRFLVSKKQTETTFQTYKQLQDQQEYASLNNIRTLRGFKNLIQISGAEVGSDKCLWGDENSIEILSNTFKLKIAIFDEKGKLIQIINQHQTNFNHIMLLRLNRTYENHEHFTLLEFNDETILKQNEWIYLKKRLGIRMT